MKRVSAKGPALLSDYFGEREAARELLQSLRTLRLWRSLRKGPSWVKIGRKIFYSRSALLSWIANQERQPVRSAQHQK